MSKDTLSRIKFALAAALIAAALSGPPALAADADDPVTQPVKKTESKPLDFFFGPAAGVVWLFLFDQDVEEIKLPPHWAIGGFVTKIWHFSWSRNMAAELSYLHSRGDGEVERLDGSTYTLVLSAEQMYLNVAYFFPGARITPYISGGGGAAYLRWQQSDTHEKGDEWDLALDAGAGMDVQLAKFWTFGPTMRVMQIFPKELTGGWITGTSVLIRTSLKF